ncbi:hypothetical protein GFM29_03155 [Rhizobium leguminosarum bv. viciae]|nr:hypothetical protein [Rhizobium leguminosarum bv. viciae]
MLPWPKTVGTNAPTAAPLAAAPAPAVLLAAAPAAAPAAVLSIRARPLPPSKNFPMRRVTFWAALPPAIVLSASISSGEKRNISLS